MKTMFALKTDAAAGFPPVLTISWFSDVRRALFIARMGLSFDRRIGLCGTSLSESGGVGKALLDSMT